MTQRLNEETMREVLALLIPSTLETLAQYDEDKCSWDEINEILMYWEDRDNFTSSYLAEMIFQDSTGWDTIADYAAAAMRIIAEMGEDRARAIAAELAAS